MSRTQELLRKGASEVSCYFLLKLLTDWVSKHYGIMDCFEKNKQIDMRQKNWLISPSGNLLDRTRLPIDLYGVPDLPPLDLLENLICHDTMVRTDVNNLLDPDYMYPLLSNTEMNSAWLSSTNETEYDEKYHISLYKTFQTKLTMKEKGENSQLKMLEIVASKGEQYLERVISTVTNFKLATVSKHETDETLAELNNIAKILNYNYALSLSSTNPIILNIKLSSYAKSKSFYITLDCDTETVILKMYDDLASRFEWLEDSLSVVERISLEDTDEQSRREILKIKKQNKEMKDTLSSNSFKKYKNRTSFKLYIRGSERERSKTTYKRMKREIEKEFKGGETRRTLTLNGKANALLLFVTEMAKVMIDEKKVSKLINEIKIKNENLYTKSELEMGVKKLLFSVVNDSSDLKLLIPSISFDTYKTANIRMIIDNCITVGASTSIPSPRTRYMRPLRTSLTGIRFQNPTSTVVMRLIIEKLLMSKRIVENDPANANAVHFKLHKDFERYEKEKLISVIVRGMNVWDASTLAKEVKLIERIVPMSIWFKPLDTIYNELLPVVQNMTKRRKFIISNVSKTENLIYFYASMIEQNLSSKKTIVRVLNTNPLFYGPDGLMEYIITERGSVEKIVSSCLNAVSVVILSEANIATDSIIRERGIIRESDEDEIINIVMKNSLKLLSSTSLSTETNFLSNRTMILDFIESQRINTNRTSSNYISQILLAFLKDYEMSIKTGIKTNINIKSFLDANPLVDWWFVREQKRKRNEKGIFIYDSSDSIEINGYFMGSPFKVIKKKGKDEPYETFTNVLNPSAAYRLSQIVTALLSNNINLESALKYRMKFERDSLKYPSLKRVVKYGNTLIMETAGNKYCIPNLYIGENISFSKTRLYKANEKRLTHKIEVSFIKQAIFIGGTKMNFRKMAYINDDISNIIPNPNKPLDDESRSLISVIQNFTAYPNTNTRMWQRTIQEILKEIGTNQRMSGIQGISKLDHIELNKIGQTIFNEVNRNNTTSKAYKLMSIIRNLIPKFNGAETYEMMLHIVRSVIKISQLFEVDSDGTQDFLTTLFLFSGMFGTTMNNECYNRFKMISWLTYQETGIWFDEWGRINKMPYYLGKGDVEVEKQIILAVRTFKENRDEIINQLLKVRSLISSIKDLSEIKQETINEMFREGKINGNEMGDLFMKAAKEISWFKERNLKLFLDRIGETQMSYDQTNKANIVLDALYSVTLLDDRSNLIELARVSKTVLQHYFDMKHNVEISIGSSVKRNALISSFKSKVDLAKPDVKKVPEDDSFSL